MKQATPKYMQLRKFEYLQQKVFETYSSFWKQYFQIRYSKGVKLLSRLRLGLSQLREHKFKYGFLNLLNPLCSCIQDIETLNSFPSLLF